MLDTCQMYGQGGTALPHRNIMMLNGIAFPFKPHQANIGLIPLNNEQARGVPSHAAFFSGAFHGFLVL